MFDEENVGGSSSPARSVLGNSNEKLNVLAAGAEESAEEADVQETVEEEPVLHEDDDEDAEEDDLSRPKPNSMDRIFGNVGRSTLSWDVVRRMVAKAERKTGRERAGSDDTYSGITASSR